MRKKSRPLKEEGMHAGAMADKFAFANLLRKTQTPQEEKSWNFLKIRPQGFKFRRQHPFKDYVLDFFCYRAKLVIELDGQHHKSNLEYDSDRTSIIESYGLKVIRFENDEIDNSFDNVKEKLMKFLKADDNFPSL